MSADWKARAEAAEDRLRKVAELAGGWATEGIPCECGHTLDTHNGLGCYERLSYEPLVTCGCKLTDDRHDGVMAADILRAVLAAPPAAPEAAETTGEARCPTCGSTGEPRVFADGTPCYDDRHPAPVSSGDAGTGEAEIPCTSCGMSPEDCMDNGDHCCEVCRATGGCSHGPAPVVAPSAEG